MDPGVREFELKFEFECYWVFLMPFYGQFVEKMCLKFQGIILLHFGLITFRFYYWKTLKLQFLGLVGALIYAYNIPKYLIFIIYNRIIH